MEQNDSLKQELRNLARIEEEQKQLLKEMNASQRSETAATQAQMMRGNAMNDGMANITKSSSVNPYAISSNTIAYGDAPPYMPYDSTYNAFSNNSASYSQSPMMNPFGSQARSAQEYYKQVQSSIGNKNLNMLDVISPSSSTSMKNRDLMGMEYGSKFGNAGLAAAGAAASFGVNWGIAGAMPGLMGMGVALGGGALIGAYTGAAIDESKKNNALAKYIYKTSGAYIDVNESNNERRLTGFSRSESYDAANFVRKMNDDFYMTDDDMSTLLQEFTEGGMLRDVKDIDTFKERMTSLTKTVKEGAILLDETYDSIAELMSDMKKLGLDSKNYSDFMGLGNILEGLTGLDASEIVRSLQDYLKNVLSGTDYDADDAYNRLKNTSVYVSKYFDELETNENRNVLQESNYNYIKNLGGPVEASKQLDRMVGEIVKSDEFENPALMFFDYDKDQKDFVFNKDKYKDFMDGNYTLQEIYADGSRKFQELEASNNAEAIDRWKNNAHSYIKNNLKGDMQTDLVQKVLGTYANDPSMIKQGFDERTILSMFGINDSAVQNFISGTMSYKDENPNLISQTNLQNMWQKDTAALTAQIPSFTEWMSSIGEKFTDTVTQGAVNLNQSIGEGIQWVTDKVSGYDRRLSPKYDQTFITRSEKLDSIEYDEVKSTREEIGREIAATKYYLGELEGKGYKLDESLSNYVNQKYEVHADDSISYQRKLIANWDDTDEDTKKNKDYIQQLAGEKDLSETIVAALLKYNQQKPNDKVDIEKLTTKMESNMVAYGGNEKLALAASLDSNTATAIDNSLKAMGYDMQGLRSAGMQEVVANVSLDGLGLDEKVLEKVNELINQNIGGSSGSGGTNTAIEGKDLSEVDFANMDLSAPSGLSVEQIQTVIDKNTADKPNSILKDEGVAQAFYDAEKEHGVSAAFLLALSGQEGTWGDSNISKMKFNPFGWGAVDADPMNKAWSWDSASEGILGFAEAVSKSYINNDKQGQNTLQKMRDGSTYSPGHRYNVHQSWVDGNSDLLKGVYETAGEVEFTEDGQVYLATTTEEVYRGKDGEKLTNEQLSEIAAKEGFGTHTEEISRMDKFLQSADVITAPNQYVGVSNSDRYDRIMTDYDALREDQAFGTHNNFIDMTGGVTGAKNFQYNMRTLIDAYQENYDPSKSMDEMIGRDKNIQGAYDKVVKQFTEDKKGLGEEYVRGVLTDLTAEKEIDRRGDRGYDVLQAWGRDFIGLTIEDTGMDISKYNQILSGEATSWYRENIDNLKGFLSADKNSEGYKAWDSMSTDEKNKTYQMLTSMQDAVGARDDENGIIRMDTLMNLKGRTKESIYSDKDAENLKYLHSDANGELYYDPSDASGSGTWEEYEEWDKTRKVSNVGTIEKEIMDSIGGNVLDGMTSTQLMSAVYDQKDSIMKQNGENWEKARDIGMRMINGKYEVSGLSKDQTVNVANMVASGDTEGLQDFKKRAKESGMSFDEKAIDSLISLTEAINSTDISVLSKLVSGIQDIVNISKDVGNTAMLLEGTMKEVFDGSSAENVMENVDAIFKKGSDVQNIIGNKNDDEALKVITDLLINGGVDFESGIEISADSLEALTSAVSEGMTKSIKDSLDSNEGIKALRNSQLYQQAITDGATVQVDGQSVELSYAVNKVAEISTSLEGMSTAQEGYKELMDEKSQLIDAITTTYLESVDDLSVKVTDGEDTLTDAQKTVDGTTKLFSTTFEKYDAAIKGSITKMNDSISELEQKQRQRKNDKTNSPFIPDIIEYGVSGTDWYSRRNGG